VDTVNDYYTDYYKHSIPTNFEDDADTWSIIKALLIFRCAVLSLSFCYHLLCSYTLTLFVFLFSLVVLVMVLVAYTYFSNRGEAEQSVTVNRYLAGALVLTSAASFAAVGLSLSTYALSHQFYTGGAYFVKARQ